MQKLNPPSTDHPESGSQVERRKEEHLRISLTQGTEYKNKTNLFEDVYLLHSALPELDRHQIDTSTTFLGHKLKAPIIITGMIGGAKEAARINRNIAQTCQNLGLGMGLGSMKAMIVEPSLTYSYQVRDVAPDIFLAGNIGANDLKHFTPKVLKETLKKIDADILAVHLNPAQELVQKEGAAEFAGVLKLIDQYSKIVPIYVKEVGQGISADVAKKLSQTNIKALDIAGAGGTNWIDIEYIRQGVTDGPLSNWGIPTAASLIMTKKVTKLPLIATGGIRTGEEVVKSIILGASVAALGLPVLFKGNADETKTKEYLQKLNKEIGDVMFLLGAKDIKNLSNIKPIIIGRLKELIS